MKTYSVGQEILSELNGSSISGSGSNPLDKVETSMKAAKSESMEQGLAAPLYNGVARSDLGGQVVPSLSDWSEYASSVGM